MAKSACSGSLSIHEVSISWGKRTKHGTLKTETLCLSREKMFYRVYTQLLIILAEKKVFFSFLSSLFCVAARKLLVCIPHKATFFALVKAEITILCFTLICDHQ